MKNKNINHTIVVIFFKKKRMNFDKVVWLEFFRFLEPDDIINYLFVSKNTNKAAKCWFEREFRKLNPIRTIMSQNYCRYRSCGNQELSPCDECNLNKLCEECQDIIKCFRCKKIYCNDCIEEKEEDLFDFHKMANYDYCEKPQKICYRICEKCADVVCNLDVPRHNDCLACISISHKENK